MAVCRSVLSFSRELIRVNECSISLTILSCSSRGGRGINLDIKNSSLIPFTVVPLEFSKKSDTKNKDEKLNYLVMYIGTTGNIDKASGMSISGIEVRAGADIDNTVTYNFQNFEVGDVVTIDNNVPAVYINDVETNEIIDIGSSFFPLLPGENTLKVASDDKDITVDVLWNDRNL